MDVPGVLKDVGIGSSIMFKDLVTLSPLPDPTQVQSLKL